MKSTLLLALLTSATMAHAQTAASAAASAPTAPAVSAAKKDLIARALVLQQPIFEGMAREIVMRPIAQMGQAAGGALQNLPPEKREAAAKAIDTDMRKFIDESVPLLRDRAIKLAPSTVGPLLEEKMSEDELKQLVTWLDSPTAKKYQQLGGELQQTMGQKLLAEASPLLLPKLQSLEQKVRATLGVPSTAASAPPAKASAPAKKASGK